MAWQENKRRRVDRSDTLGDIYAQRPPHVADKPSLHPRRMSSVVDPAIHSHHSHHSPQLAVHAPALVNHHRPSLSYPPPHAPVSAGAHVRHQSSPGPQLHSVHRPLYSGMAPEGAYPPPPASYGHGYEHRPSYYQDYSPASQAYPHDRRSEPNYFSRSAYHGPSHSGYEPGYNEVRFQNHVGMDPNTFNRKRRGNLPKDATNILKRWFHDNRATPYPSEDQKLELCTLTNLSMNQVR
jgi:hypothetical protein